MANTIPDIRGTLEEKSPPLADLLALREASLTSREVRLEIDAFMNELPAIIEDAGRSEAAIRTVGYGLFVIGEDRRASEWLAKAGSDPRIRHVYGRALIGAGRFLTAAEALEPLEKAETDSRPACMEAWLRGGDTQKARRVMGKLLKADAESAEGMYLGGYLSELEGDYDAAYEAFDRALEMSPGYARALFRKAYCSDLDGNEDEAVALYEELRTQRPTYTNALVNLGVLYEDRGEYSKAIECYEQIIAVDPNHRRARRFLGDAKASLNMYYDEDLERTEDRRAQILKIPISDFELSVRSRNCLAKMSIETLGDLIKKSEPELLSYKNFGETSLQEIKDILAQKGLRLGMGREEQKASIQSAARTLLGIEPEKGDVLEKAIEDLELSVRSRNAMKVLGIDSLGELAKMSEKELMLVKNFGQTSMNEVKEKLAEFGLALAPNEP
ncbi:MAG: DNA-directed RNA polymerase subunit alpha C-terminal domain-containing protein [Planctomycetota bacterium]